MSAIRLFGLHFSIKIIRCSGFHVRVRYVHTAIIASACTTNVVCTSFILYLMSVPLSNETVKHQSA